MEMEAHRNSPTHSPIGSASSHSLSTSPWLKPPSPESSRIISFDALHRTYPPPLYSRRPVVSLRRSLRGMHLWPQRARERARLHPTRVYSLPRVALHLGRMACTSWVLCERERGMQRGSVRER
jgi:hypothetical protein